MNTIDALEIFKQLPYDLQLLVYEYYVTLWTDEEVRCGRHPLRNILWDIEYVTWGIRDEFEMPYSYKPMMNSNKWFYGTKDFADPPAKITVKRVISSHFGNSKPYREWHINPHTVAFKPSINTVELMSHYFKTFVSKSTQ